MGKFKTVPVDELRGRRRLKPEDQVKFDELRGYVEGLAKGQAGIYECDPGENPKKVRNLLRRVAGRPIPRSAFSRRGLRSSSSQKWSLPWSGAERVRKKGRVEGKAESSWNPQF